jgi:NADH-quinone oxidoreductase subunit L
MGRHLSKRPLPSLARPVGLSALAAISAAISFIGNPPEGNALTQTLWTWMQFGGYTQAITFALDPLSLVMILIVTVVGFFIHLYSMEYMIDDEGYSRFFAYMNLFVGSMLILVLSDNLLLLYLGWEGVGLCSYLLIGFWYTNPANGRAARKAFIVTRIGDTAMALGLFLLFTNLGTLNIRELMTLAPKQWPVGSETAVLAAALLLGGALGKSAQLPFQVWLPDAMAGPTPVSALIHAATMVTAGVYLIARTHVLFELAPIVQSAVALIGAATLLIAGLSAIAQKDIKRVLAYSTISQLGYMFLALGVGAWSAAIFHLMTHAFFKALLFLGAGVVILAQRHEQDMFKMGGLKDKLPVTFWTFLIGSASLSALPLVTAGFYSKDLILWKAWSSGSGSMVLWAAGLFGAFITSIYTFRMVFLTFFGRSKPAKAISREPGCSHRSLSLPYSRSSAGLWSCRKRSETCTCSRTFCIRCSENGPLNMASVKACSRSSHRSLPLQAFSSPTCSLSSALSTLIGSSVCSREKLSENSGLRDGTSTQCMIASLSGHSCGSPVSTNMISLIQDMPASQLSIAC